MKNRQNRDIFLVEDETDLRLFPNIRAAWASIGAAAAVVVSGKNAKRVVFGAMNIETGKRIFLPRMRQRQEDFQDFLKLCRRIYRGWHIVMILDEDSSHIAARSKSLAEDLGIELLWLPNRTPQLIQWTLFGGRQRMLSALTGNMNPLMSNLLHSSIFFIALMTQKL